jgi:integrase
MEQPDLKQGYITGLLSLVKSMAKKAGVSGYAIDISYEDVTVDDEESFSVYLSLNEITRIYFFKGLTKYQARIRDLFVVGCMTALRFSDYSTLTRDNFSKDYITKITKKTGKKVILPIHDYVREIFTRYDGEISPGITNQHFNRYIKKICNLVGLNEQITFNYTKGGKLITETKEKWELITSHTARRSAATNMYLTGRLKTYEIMSLTGHTTEKSFFRYIRVTGEDISKHLAGDNFFRK